MIGGSSRRTVVFWKPRDKYGELSQWYRSRFHDDVVDVIYTSCEQYMMYQKALLFSDNDMAPKILNEHNPGKIKKMGQQVRNFDQEVWDVAKYDIVVNGNYLKFTQDPRLRRVLCNIEDLIAEASPYDRIYGIGLHPTDPRTQDPEQWQGENLLGDALMEVRRRLWNGE